MNVFVMIDGVVMTPPTEELTILHGVTRDSCIQLMRDNGFQVEERDITVDDVRNAHLSGTLQDAFGTGTAATVAPIGEIGYHDEHYPLPAMEDRPVSAWLKEAMRNLRKGHSPDTYGWLHSV